MSDGREDWLELNEITVVSPLLDERILDLSIPRVVDNLFLSRYICILCPRSGAG
jgi:hypothetical protein